MYTRHVYILLYAASNALSQQRFGPRSLSSVYPCQMPYLSLKDNQMEQDYVNLLNSVKRQHAVLSIVLNKMINLNYVADIIFLLRPVQKQD